MGFLSSTGILYMRAGNIPNQVLVQNILSIVLFIVPLFIALRSFMLYMQVRSIRLLILALSMSIIALTAAAGFAGDNITSVTLNVDWFNYIGQTICFLFIWLSLLRSDGPYLQRLWSWQIILFLPILLLLAFSPVLPADFPNPAVTKTLLSGSRGLICAFIFYYYVGAFMKKETRFSLLMGIAFLLLSLGIFIILPKYSFSKGFLNTDLFDLIGDITRITGLVALLAAVIGG